MSKLKIFYVLVVAIAFNSCEKMQNKKVQIKGVFWDYCGEQPLAGFKIKLIEGDDGTGRLFDEGNSTLEIAELVTDANGRFDFGEVDINKKTNKYYHIYAVYDSDKDFLSYGSGSGAPWNVKNCTGIYINRDNKEQIIKTKLFEDTIRACSFNKNLGVLRISPPPTYSDEDSIYITSIFKYLHENEMERGVIDLKSINSLGERNLGFVINDCGKWILKFEFKKNGVKRIDFDTVFVKWKVNPAFEHTISF